MFIIKCGQCGQEAGILLCGDHNIKIDGLIYINMNADGEFEFDCFNCGHTVTEQT